MNTTGCASNTARDNLFQSNEQPCSISLQMYFSVTGIAILFRTILTLAIVVVAISAYRRALRESKSKARFSITSIIETTHYFVAVLFFISAGVVPDVVNGQTGIGPLGIILTTGIAQMAFIISLLKLIHLGKRVLPKDLRGTTEDDSRLSSVSADKILYFVFISTWTFQIVAFLLAIATASVGRNSPNIRDVLARSSMFFNGATQISASGVLLRQTWRITSYMSNVILSVEKSGVVVANSDTRKSMKTTQRRMINRSYGVIIVLAHSSLYIYAAFSGYFPIYLTFLSWFVNILSVSITMVQPLVQFYKRLGGVYNSSVSNTSSPVRSAKDQKQQRFVPTWTVTHTAPTSGALF